MKVIQIFLSSKYLLTIIVILFIVFKNKYKFIKTDNFTFSQEL